MNYTPKVGQKTFGVQFNLTQSLLFIQKYVLKILIIHRNATEQIGTGFAPGHEL